jgi:methyl-accepting chemotaxis protein
MAWFTKSEPKSASDIGGLKAQVVDKISTAVMMVDRNFLVTYVNEPTMDLLRKNAQAFRAIWPNFDPERILGTCIDTFHKNPGHQRNLLSDPSRLPFRTEITIGDLKVQLLVNGTFDPQGKYVGNVLEWRDVTEARTNEGMLVALNKSQAVIEFTLDGKIVHANENFLKTLGYTLEEIRGQHHSMFVEPSYRASDDYRRFWEKLGRGEFDAGQYKRIGKGGKEIWIQASYNPIVDSNGKPFKVVKYATDVTATATAVAQTQEVVQAAENNDLSRRIPMEGKSGDIRILCEGVNGLLDAFSSVVGEIKSVAEEVTNASGEISASTTDLSQRTEEQAASLEQTSSSMEQISATVKKNADNAQHATQSATDTRAVAERGGDVVRKAVEAMSAIEQSSSKISDIIGVIDEIARQTNLLALNAAVEAARAGEAGRGFAVVASEVRSLAQRSSQAAKDIKGLITDGNGQVKQGVDLVNRAGTALDEIVASVKNVAEIISDIAVASLEQSSGIEQVNKALAQMDEVTQQNSALVEQNAATAKALEEQAQGMNSRVSQFHIDGASEQVKVVRLNESRAAPAERAAKAAASAERTPKAQAPARATPGQKAPARVNGRAQTSTALKSDVEWAEF